MVFTRHPQNPLITPADVMPSRSDFEVMGAFNAGVTRYKDEVILLLRVAERPINYEVGWIAYPLMDENGAVSIQTIALTNARYNLSDSRLIVDLQIGQIMLTSISHLHIA